MITKKTMWIAIVCLFFVFVIPNFLLSSNPFDSLNVSFVGNWPFGPSKEAVAIDSLRNIAFCGSGAGIYILDVSDPSNPIKISEIRTKGYVFGLSYNSSTQDLYMALDPIGLEIWDVSNLSNPQKLGYYYVANDYVRDVEVSGSYAYLAASCGFQGGSSDSAGLYIIDISNPSNPILAGFLNILFARGVAIISSNYVYVTNGANASCVVDVSDPTNPSIAGSVGGWADAEDAVVSGNYLYEVDDFWGMTYGGFRIIDISDPTNPSIIYTQEIGSGYCIAVRGNYLYYGVSSLMVFDISDPNNPTWVNTVSIPSYGIVLADTFAFIAGNNSFYVTNIADPVNPWITGSYLVPSTTCYITISGNYAFATAYYDGVYVMDISDPANPQKISQFNDIPQDECRAVAVSGNYAYVADGFSGLRVVDISDPSNPYEVGFCDTRRAYDVVVEGNYAYVADYDTTLVVIDISVPQNPTKVGFFDGGYAYKIDFKAPYVFTAGSSDLIIDVSDPNNPQYISTLPLSYGGGCIAVHPVSPYVYITDGLYLRVVDIADPYNPYIVYSYLPPESTYISDITISGNFLYLGNRYSGLRVFDISNPENPFEVGYYKSHLDYSSFLTLGVAVSGQYIYTGQLNMGFWVFKNLLATGIETPSFSVIAESYCIKLEWKLYVEDGCLQYLILKKSTQENEDYSEIARISGYGSSPSPKVYSYIDKDVKTGIRYYYKLGVVKENGSTNWYGPVSAVVTGTRPFLSISPNPFTTSTTISFTRIGQSAEGMGLNIYDVCGRLVKRFTIHDLRFTDVTWDGKDDNGRFLPSGIYYCRLIQENSIQTRKILFVK